MNDLPSNQPPSSPQFQPNLKSSVSLIHVVGYGLLVLTIFNLVDILVPLRLMQPVWELQTIGALVESTPIPLLSLILIFYQEGNFRWKWEPLVLKIIAWFSLLLGVVLLLLIPLTVSNTIRLNIQANGQISSDYSQQISQVEEFQTELEGASTEDLTSFLASQGISLDGQDPQQIKEQLLTRFSQTRQEIQTQYETERANRRASLLKNAVKWILSALVSGFIFIYIWRQTARVHWSTKHR